MTTTVATLHGQNVVVTGKVYADPPANCQPIVRGDAESMLAKAGAFVQPRVTQDTNILVYGENVGKTKTDKASAVGAATLPWAEALELMKGGTPVQSGPPPSPQPGRNQPIMAQAGYRQVKPMLAKGPEDPTRTPEQLVEPLVASGNRWSYEPKWDGYRAVAHVTQFGPVFLQSRTGMDMSRYQHIIDELAGLPGKHAILDGELVVLDADGNSDLERLHAGEIGTVSFVVFDMVQAADGTDIRGQSLDRRRELLTEFLSHNTQNTYIAQSPVFDSSEVVDLLEYYREAGQEGIVCKHRGSVYKEGSRNGNWLKIKLRLQQEFVVLGYTHGKGARAGTAGAFLLGVNAGTKTEPKWEYVGDVGTGGTIEQFEEIRQLATSGPGGPVDTKRSPIKDRFTQAKLKEITFVTPDIILDVKFQKWTTAGAKGEYGKLWHPAIQGIKTDKHPLEVTRET